jgi:hypothetical protein
MRAAGCFAALALAGCLTPTIEITPVAASPKTLKPRTVESVAVIHDAKAPANTVSVYVIQASEGSVFRREPMIREEAARLGCDAVQVIPPGVSHGTVVAASTGALIPPSDPEMPELVGQCLVYK